MKNLIVYTAILVVLTLGVIFKSDYLAVEMTELVLKNNLDTAAAGATMLIDEKSYSEGYVVFKDSEIVAYVSEVLGNECDNYTVHIFDSRGKHREYNKIGFVGEESFSFPSFYEDRQGIKNNIQDSSIVIEGTVRKEFYRISELKNRKTEISRSTMYVLEGREVKI